MLRKRPLALKCSQNSAPYTSQASLLHSSSIVDGLANPHETPRNEPFKAPASVFFRLLASSRDYLDIILQSLFLQHPDHSVEGVEQVGHRHVTVVLVEGLIADSDLRTKGFDQTILQKIYNSRAISNLTIILAEGFHIKVLVIAHQNKFLLHIATSRSPLILCLRSET